MVLVVEYLCPKPREHFDTNSFGPRQDLLVLKVDHLDSCSPVKMKVIYCAQCAARCITVPSATAMIGDLCFVLPEMNHVVDSPVLSPGSARSKQQGGLNTNTFMHLCLLL